MLEPVIQFFERLISDFSWRRLLLLAAVLGIATAAIWAYESYTGTLRLARIAKEVTALERLSDLRARQEILKDPRLAAIYLDLQGKLRDSTSQSRQVVLLPPQATKILAAAAAWFVLGLLVFGAGRSQDGSRFTGSTAIGMVVVAIPFVVLAAFLPTFEAGWINYLLYPVGHVVIIVGAILAFQARKSKSAV